VYASHYQIPCNCADFTLPFNFYMLTILIHQQNVLALVDENLHFQPKVSKLVNINPLFHFGIISVPAKTISVMYAKKTLSHMDHLPVRIVREREYRHLWSGKSCIE
jgi:hypothetical protein